MLVVATHVLFLIEAGSEGVVIIDGDDVAGVRYRKVIKMHGPRHGGLPTGFVAEVSVQVTGLFY